MTLSMERQQYDSKQANKKNTSNPAGQNVRLLEKF